VAQLRANFFIVCRDHERPPWRTRPEQLADFDAAGGIERCGRLAISSSRDPRPARAIATR
jgi:hypothetical protein